MVQHDEVRRRIGPLVARAADLGVPGVLIPPRLASVDFVETYYEDQILELLIAQPSRVDVLTQRSRNCDATTVPAPD